MQVTSLQLTKVKPVLSGHTKIDKTRVLKTNGSLMKVVSIAECSLGAFCNTFDLHEVIIDLEPKFFVFLEWSLKTGFTVFTKAERLCDNLQNKTTKMRRLGSARMSTE